MWPTLHLSFSAAQAVFACLFAGLTLASLFLWLRTLDWQLPALELATLAFFTLGSFPVLQGIKLQNLSLLAAFLVAATLAALAADRFDPGRYAPGGCDYQAAIRCLANSMARPVDNGGIGSRRHSFGWSFLAWMSFLILSSELLAPGWIPHFFAIIRAYQQYTYGHSLLDVWFTPKIGLFVGVVFILATFTLCWRYRPSPAKSTEFLLASSLLLAVTLVVIPTLAPHTQLLLLPGFLLLLRYGSSIRQSSRWGGLFLVAAWIGLPAWAWIAAVNLTLAAAWVPSGNLLQFWMLPLYTSPLIPLGVVLALGLLLRSKFAFHAA